MSVTTPAGFRAAGVAAGLKSTGGKDLALVVNDGPTYDSASVFTANRCKANPVLWSQEVVKDGIVRAVVLNSGGANCYTGPEGFQTTHAVAEQVAGHLGIGAIDVVVCSTGLIGLANPRQPARRASTTAYAALSESGGPAAAEAIMTTDSVSKQAVVEGAGWIDRRHGQGRRHARTPARHDARRDHHRRRRPGRRPRRGTARGHPGQLRPARLRRLHVHQRHRHRHGQRRQRDHAAAVGLHRRAHPGSAPTWRCSCSRDAEGADHDIAITTLNAASEDDAVEVGRSVARSNLFKAAVFGKDPNWGRVLASIGTTAGGLRPRRPRRRHERRLGLQELRRRTPTPPPSTCPTAR